MKRYGLPAAFVLLVVVTIMILTGVWYNRSGEPDAVVELTERELPLAWSERANSEMSLRLNWQRYDESGLDWFDRKKLSEIGFDCRTPLTAADAELRYGKALSRKTFVVLEFEGPAWELWQSREKKKLAAMEADVVAGISTRKDLEKARKRFEWELVVASRLFPVDAGNDPFLLRKRHPDRRRCIITPAVVRLRYHAPQHEKGGAAKAAEVTGWIDEILTGTVHVPRERQGLLGTLRSSKQMWQSFYYEEEWEKKPIPPRYTAVLDYGKRFEPWVVAVRPYAGGGR
jgi:hypothetical protein